MKSVSVIGSTGSVGKNALKAAKELGYQIKSITGHSNLPLLKQQADEFSPHYVGIINKSLHNDAKKVFGNKLVMGMEALHLTDADVVVISVTGVSGIYPLIDTLKKGKRAALANKESLVAGGALVAEVLKKSMGEIVPVDSEHSAIFQCLKSGNKSEVSRIILTASGGAFYTRTKEELEKITPKDIFHPNWKMGRKITLDSCTMMNKALEIIEASWLFGTKNIDYVVHPESIIHSMVEFKDGIVMAQIAPPDMVLPLKYALSYPNRIDSKSPPFSFQNLTFIQKNQFFNAPDLAMRVLETGGSTGTVLNAANEAATQLFEQGKIPFTDIVRVVEKHLYDSENQNLTNIDEIIKLHNETMERVYLSPLPTKMK